MDWRDHDKCSGAFIQLADGKMHKLTVWAPNEYSDVWTSEAELLDADFAQLKYSGLHNGGDTRDKAKAAALIAPGQNFVTTDTREVTMKITVNVPKDRASEYLRLIADELEDDCTSGHWDAQTNWETEDDE